MNGADSSESYSPSMQCSCSTVHLLPSCLHVSSSTISSNLSTFSNWESYTLALFLAGLASSEVSLGLLRGLFVCLAWDDTGWVSFTHNLILFLLRCSKYISLSSSSLVRGLWMNGLAQNIPIERHYWIHGLWNQQLRLVNFSDSQSTAAFRPPGQNILIEYFLVYP